MESALCGDWEVGGMQTSGVMLICLVEKMCGVLCSKRTPFDGAMGRRCSHKSTYK